MWDSLVCRLTREAKPPFDPVDRLGARRAEPREVLHSEVNAARNVCDRNNDSDITRYMPYKDVRKILLQRSSGGVLPLKRLEFGPIPVRQPSADIISAQK